MFPYQYYLTTLVSASNIPKHYSQCTITTRQSKGFSQVGSRWPRGLPIYPKVRGNEIPCIGVLWCTTNRKGTNKGYTGVQQQWLKYLVYSLHAFLFDRSFMYWMIDLYIIYRCKNTYLPKITLIFSQIFCDTISFHFIPLFESPQMDLPIKI